MQNCKKSEYLNRSKIPAPPKKNLNNWTGVKNWSKIEKFPFYPKSNFLTFFEEIKSKTRNIKQVSLPFPCLFPRGENQPIRRAVTFGVRNNVIPPHQTLEERWSVPNHSIVAFIITHIPPWGILFLYFVVFVSWKKIWRNEAFIGWKDNSPSVVWRNGICFEKKILF